MDYQNKYAIYSYKQVSVDDPQYDQYDFMFIKNDNIYK